MNAESNNAPGRVSSGGPRPVERVAAIAEGEELFHSRGASLVKVTRGGETRLLEIPIRTAGVGELMEDLARRSPRPPVKREWIRKDSPEGRALKLHQDRLVQLLDLADEGYVRALADHERAFVWAVAVQALDVAFHDAHGRPVDDPERKKAILQAAGLTADHLAKILGDVRRLTRLAEEEEDFLSGDASA